ncbi:MAG TPA: DNA polymerase Y family protein, partial [Pirellulales bacterium]
MKPACSNNRALCLWLPQWPLQRLRIVRPELKHRDLILYAPLRGSLRIVCSSRRDISLGMSLAEAKSLVDAQFEQHDLLADQAALLRLAAQCEEFSPIVGLEQPDNLCLDVSGIGSLFGGEQALAQQIVRALHRLGVIAKVAVADTIGTAWAVAHFGKGSPVIIPSGHTEKVLAGLPIAALRLDDTDLLTELGIQQIGQLLAVPRDALASRFDPQLLCRLDQALGLRFEPILSHRTPPDITAETELEYPIADRYAVDFVLGQLTERIAATLTERQQGAIRLECRLRCEGGETVKVVVGLYRASAHAKHLLELA